MAASTSTTYAFQHPRASLLPLLHAAKYPSSIIVGCLLGPIPSPSAPASARTIEYHHAIPLLHHWTGLTFALEAGLQFVEQYCKAKQWVVLGFYYATDSISSHRQQTPLVVKRLQEVIEGNAEGPAPKGKQKSSDGDDASFKPSIFALDNQNLAHPDKAFAQTYPAASTSPKFTYVSTPSTSGQPSRLHSLLKAKQHQNLADWDDHLEDMGARWLENQEVELELDDAEIAGALKAKQGNEDTSKQQ